MYRSPHPSFPNLGPVPNLSASQFPVALTLTSLPAKGMLFQWQDNGKPIPTLLPSGLTPVLLWVSELLDFSSEYDSGYSNDYHAVQLIGPPLAFVYGDNIYSWCAWNVNGYASLDPQFTYTDYVVVRYPAMVYPSQLTLIEVCLGTVVHAFTGVSH